MQTSQLLLEILGKERSESDKLLLNLIEIVHENPIVQSDDVIWLYDFPQSGFTLWYNEDNGSFIVCRFDVLLPHRSELQRKTYSQELPFNFKPMDSYREVEQKLPGATMTIKDYQRAKDLRPLVVSTAFYPPGPPRAPLMFVTVSYEPNNSSSV